MPAYGKSTSQGAAAHPGTRSEEPPKGGHSTGVRKKHLNRWKIQLLQKIVCPIAGATQEPGVGQLARLQAHKETPKPACTIVFFF